MIAKIPSDSIPAAGAKTQKPDELKRVCAEFESLFLNYLLKSMRASVPESGFIEQGEENKILKSMLDEKLADRLKAKDVAGQGAPVGDDQDQVARRRRRRGWPPLAGLRRKP